MDLEKELQAFKKRHPELKFEDVGPTKRQFYMGLALFAIIGSAIMRFLAILFFRENTKGKP